MVNQASEIVQQILSLESSYSTTLVAIDGKGGAGKSTLANILASQLETTGRRVDIVHFDDFYLPSSLRMKGEGAEKPIGGDFDWERLRDQVLEPLRDGRKARFERYDWCKDVLTEAQHILPGAIVIVEGVFSSRDELAAKYDFRIWVDCPRQLRLKRGIERDGESYRDRWEQDWMPSEDRYVENHQPIDRADFVVSGEAG